jgi:hypothetical protein
MSAYGGCSEEKLSQYESAESEGGQSRSFWNRYEIDWEDKIGSGCSANVFRARSKLMNESCFTSEVGSNSCMHQLNCNQKLIVKVCDVSEPTKLEAARNERQVLHQLPTSDFCNRFLAYHEDLAHDQAFMVLEEAGQ